MHCAAAFVAKNHLQAVQTRIGVHLYHMQGMGECTFILLGCRLQHTSQCAARPIPGWGPAVTECHWVVRPPSHCSALCNLEHVCLSVTSRVCMGILASLTQGDLATAWCSVGAVQAGQTRPDFML